MNVDKIVHFLMILYPVSRKIMEKPLHQILEEVGLNDKESSLYLACLQYGKVTPSTLSRMTNIARPSIYDHMKRLVAK